MSFRSTELPWILDPFRLISWQKMLEFSAQQFIAIGIEIQGILCIWQNRDRDEIDRSFATNIAEPRLRLIAKGLREIGCAMSADLTESVIQAMRLDEAAGAMKARIESLEAAMRSEMKSHLFLWVDGQRAGFYTKSGQELLGQECSSRFASVIGEAEEAMRCYAVGRFTASAFHLMRMTEVGVRALGLAIGFKIKNENWGRILAEFQRQKALLPATKPPHWKGRFKKLNTIGAHLEAVNEGWRNRIAHLDLVYGEEQARHLLTVIPHFLANEAQTIDEDGRFV